MFPRPRFLYISAKDPDRAIDDPALASLAAAGWSVHGGFPAAMGNDPTPKFVFLMWPPTRLPITAGVLLVVAGASFSLGALIVAVGWLSAASGGG